MLSGGQALGLSPYERFGRIALGAATPPRLSKLPLARLILVDRARFPSPRYESPLATNYRE